MTPRILSDIVEALKSSNLKAVKENTEGRINSKKDEDAIIEWLKIQPQFSGRIKEGRLRNFMDMEVLDYDGVNTYAVNIKTSFGAAPDNAFSKLGLLWAFTDMSIEDFQRLKIGQKIKDDKFSDLIICKKKETPRDYWYLSLDKSNFQNAIVRGVKQIKFWNKNPTNNLQINWSFEHKVKDVEIKTFEEVYFDVITDGVFKCWAEKSAQWANAVVFRQQHLGNRASAA